MGKAMALDWIITVERLDAKLALWRGYETGNRELIVVADLERASFRYEGGKGGLRTGLRLNGLSAGDANGKTFLWTEASPMFDMDLSSWEDKGAQLFLMI